MRSSRSRAGRRGWSSRTPPACAVRLPSSLSASSLARMSRLLSGVRSSWLMLARNSRLVLGGERQLLGLLLEGALGLLDFAVLALHLRLLLGEQLRLLLAAPRWSAAAPPAALEQLLGAAGASGLLLQPLVGLGELLLLLAELVGERLGLLEQGLRAHVGGDGVEHDADGLGELLEEGQVDLAEAVEGGQLDDGLDLTLEEHREDDDVARHLLAQAGGDADVRVRHVRQEDGLLLQGSAGGAGRAAARGRPARAGACRGGSPSGPGVHGLPDDHHEPAATDGAEHVGGVAARHADDDLHGARRRRQHAVAPTGHRLHGAADTTRSTSPPVWPVAPTAGSATA